MCHTGGKKENQNTTTKTLQLVSVTMQFTQMDNMFGTIHKETFQTFVNVCMIHFYGETLYISHIQLGLFLYFPYF